MGLAMIAGLAACGWGMGVGGSRPGAGEAGATTERKPLRVGEGSVISLAANFNSPGRRTTVRRKKSVEGQAGILERLRVRRPESGAADGSSPAEAGDGLREVTVTKSSAYYDVEDLNAPRRKWRHLTQEIRQRIDTGSPRKGQWEMIVLHNSQTAKGGAKAFDYYHRTVKGMRNGLAYHFVIGNGTYTGDGEIEVGNRWLEQLEGGHLRSGDQNRVAIGICLVGDFNQEKVTRRQLEALDELVEYLRAKVGEIDLTTHRQVNVSPTDCPGRFFPTELVMTLR